MVLLLAQCVPEAPHSNPLDPYHATTENSTLVTVSGEVLHKNPPHQPIAGCLVLLTPGQQYSRTNNQGEFSFENISPGAYQLAVSRDGYAVDSLSIQTDTLGSTPLAIYLNGLPYIKSMHIYSEFIDQYWPDPYFQVRCEAANGDPDGANDITGAVLRIPELDISRPLDETASPDSMAVTLAENDFPGNDIFGMVGKEVWIDLTDRSESTVSAGPYYLHRIIDVSPVALEPAGLQTVGPRPQFVWDPYSAPFNFTYEVNIYYVPAGIRLLIHTIRGIPTSEQEYSFTDSLANGNYFWAIGVRDELGNYSRSKEEAFVVQ